MGPVGTPNSDCEKKNVLLLFEFKMSQLCICRYLFTALYSLMEYLSYVRAQWLLYPGLIIYLSLALSTVHFILGRQFMCVISMPIIMSSLIQLSTSVLQIWGGREFKMNN